MKLRKILLQGKKHFQLCLAIDNSPRDLSIMTLQPAKVKSSKPEPIRLKNNSKLSLSFGDTCKATAAVFSSKGSQLGQKLFHFVFQDLVYNRQLPSVGLFVCFKGKLSLLPDVLVRIFIIPHSCEFPLQTPLHTSETWTLIQ